MLAPEEIEEALNLQNATKKKKASRKPVKTMSQAAKKEHGRKMKLGVKGENPAKALVSNLRN